MNRPATLLAALLLALGAGPAAAPVLGDAAAPPDPAPDPWVTVATGLRSPGGVTIAPDGRVLVAEAGTGGDRCIERPEGRTLCAGTTGAVTAVGAGGAERIADGLPSVRTADGRIVGPAEVAVRPDGTLLVTIGSPGDAADRAALPADVGSLLGTVLAIPPGGGTPVVLADLVAWEADNDPDADDPNADRASDPSGAALRSDGSLVVADAAANALVSVAAGGAVTLLAHLPAFEHPVMGAPLDGGDPRAPTLPPGIPGLVPLHAAPVTVAVGADGAIVAGLRTSDPSVMGAGRIVRIDRYGDPVTLADRFTAIADLAVAPDGSILVLAPAYREVPGVIWSVAPGGGTASPVATGPLADPAGIAVDGAGTVLVADRGTLPDRGTLRLWQRP